MEGEYRFSNNSKKNIKDVRVDLIELVERVLYKSPHDFGIPKTGGYRTAEGQHKLFHQVPKVTNCDGYKKLSYHQSGNAVDIFVYDEHGACWSCLEKYNEIADLMKAEFILMQEECLFQDEKFRWGGDWRNPDRPHFEIRSI